MRMMTQRSYVEINQPAAGPDLARNYGTTPARGPSPLRQKDELDNQLTQLDQRRKIDAVNSDLYSDRRAQVRRRQMQLSGRSNASLAPKQDTVLGSWAGRAWQRLLTKLVHPAASWLPPRAMAVGQSKALVARGLDEGWAKRTTFWADDEGAALLDGLVIGRGPATDRAGKPHILVVPGFAMTYEAIVRQAKSFADDFDAVVVLHNSRGVGRSLGTQHTIDQAVEDCKAVIRSLLKDGHTHLGVYGISMGSATAFRAIQDMSSTGELRAGDIGLAASVRGLSSIPNVVGAHLGFAFAAASRWLLRRANLPDMDVTRILCMPLLAAELMVTTAGNDWLVKGKGQLAQALNLPADGVATLPSGQEVTVVSHHGRGHVDPQVRTPGHDAVLQRWADRARALHEASRFRPV